jgi:hypothetical protein
LKSNGSQKKQQLQQSRNFQNVSSRQSFERILSQATDMNRICLKIPVMSIFKTILCSLKSSKILFATSGALYTSNFSVEIQINRSKSTLEWRVTNQQPLSSLRRYWNCLPKLFAVVVLRIFAWTCCRRCDLTTGGYVTPSYLVGPMKNDDDNDD